LIEVIVINESVGETDQASRCWGPDMNPHWDIYSNQTPLPLSLKVSETRWTEHCRTYSHQKRSSKKKTKIKVLMYLHGHKFENWVLTTYSQASTGWRVDHPHIRPWPRFRSLDGEIHSSTQPTQHWSEARKNKSMLSSDKIIGAFRRVAQMRWSEQEICACHCGLNISHQI
jgi:hypothetical protein